MSKLIPILLVLFALSFLARSDHSFDQDLGRHIKLGEIILKTGEVPKINLFSYTNPDFLFINTHWLFEVLAFAFNQTVGINWLLYLKIITILTAVFLTIRQIDKKHYPLLLPVGFIFLHVLRERLDLRPEIFSFLFTALTLFILKSYVRKVGPCEPKTIFLLPIIQLIWINTHIYFFVGLILQAIFLVSLAYQHLRSHPTGGLGWHLLYLLVVFALSVAVSFINPNGLDGLLYPLNVRQNYGYTIVENQTMSLLESIGFTDRNFLFVKISLALIILSLITGYVRKTLNLFNLMLLTLGPALALLNVRSFPYLVFISLPATLESFGPVKFNAFFKTLTALAAILLITESVLYINGNYYRYTDSQEQVFPSLPESGRKALDFVIKNNLPAPHYNNFDIGSYIIYRGYPEYRVFVDGRPEAYPKEFFQNTYIPSQSDYSLFKKLEGSEGFKTIIFSHTDQTPWGKAFLSALSKDNNWILVYLDDTMVVYVKQETATALNLEAPDLNNLDPGNFNYSNHLSYLKIALFLINSQNIPSANLFIEKALEVFPNSPIANKLKAHILLSSGNITGTQAAAGFLQSSKNIYFW